MACLKILCKDSSHILHHSNRILHLEERIQFTNVLTDQVWVLYFVKPLMNQCRMQFSIGFNNGIILTVSFLRVDDARKYFC